MKMLQIVEKEKEEEAIKILSQNKAISYLTAQIEPIAKIAVTSNQQWCQ